MTISLTLNDRIANVRKMLDEVEAYMQDLRNAPRQRAGAHVLMWDNGLCVSMKDGQPAATNVIGATVFATSRVPGGWVVRNGANERAKLVPYEGAIARSLTVQEDLHTWLCGQLRDLYAEHAGDYENSFV